MKSLIDFSLFFFDCIDFIDNNKDLRFTYKTNEQGFFKLCKNFHEKLREICKTENFHTKLSKRKNDHIIDDRVTKEKIECIFKHKKYPKKWIEEYVWNSILYQLEFCSKKQRLFYIFEVDRLANICVVKPLFLDLNHALNPETNRKGSRDNVRYEKCFICHNQICR